MYLGIAHLPEHRRCIFVKAERCADLNNLTVIHDDDSVIVRNRLQSMSDGYELTISSETCL